MAYYGKVTNFALKVIISIEKITTYSVYVLLIVFLVNIFVVNLLLQFNNWIIFIVREKYEVMTLN